MGIDAAGNLLSLALSSQRRRGNEAAARSLQPACSCAERRGGSPLLHWKESDRVR